jgi:hypothetical protein
MLSDRERYSESILQQQQQLTVSLTLRKLFQTVKGC